MDSTWNTKISFNNKNNSKGGQLLSQLFISTSLSLEVVINSHYFYLIEQSMVCILFLSMGIELKNGLISSSTEVSHKLHFLSPISKLQYLPISMLRLCVLTLNLVNNLLSF